jgi:kynurenine formamidase
MDVRVTVNERDYAIDLGSPLDISIPMRFDGVDQPSVFGTPAPAMRPFVGGDFIGSVRQGGAVNCEIYMIIPHCNGTHTECVGHIAEERISIADILTDTLIPATLVTIAPESAADTHETYDPAYEKKDTIISRAELEKALQGGAPGFLEALIIRTIPNGHEKVSRNYDQDPPAFFSRTAMEYIVTLGVKHLLVDVPSVDRLKDEGKLTCHHTYWQVEAESSDIAAADASPRTITEMIYVPDDVRDGSYILNLQIAPFMADAAPSRPILFEVK